jgi:uncharacterized membrane-anchored protein YitT (DUF2179 family)
MWEAFGRRLRRNYLWIYLMLFVSWIGKSYLFPQPALNVQEFIQRGAIGPVHGIVIITLGIVYHVFLLLIAIGTVGMTKASGEVLPRFGDETITSMFGSDDQSKSTRPFFAPRRRRRQLVALIITGKPDAVSKRIMTDLRRGVTSLAGKGMYTGQDRSVLICALTVTEVHNLKHAVALEDPTAFVVVSAAQEILGRGFNPLSEN